MPPRKPKKWVRTVNSHLKTDWPKAIRCGGCGDTVLIGYVAGILERMDITPLSPVGELEALFLKRKTYYLIPQCQHLGERTVSTIKRELRPRMNGSVIRQHVCHTPRSTYQEPVKRHDTYDDSEGPPF